MEESSTSLNFVGVTDLKKTSMASSREYLAHKRKVRKDSPLRRGSEMSLSFKRGAQDRKIYRRRIKVNNVLESKPDMPEVFRITALKPQTNENTEEGKTRECLRNNTKHAGEEKEKQRIQRQGETLSSTDSQHLKTRTKTTSVTQEDQRPHRCLSGKNKEEHFLQDSVLFRNSQTHQSPPRTPLCQTPWFTEELVDVSDESRIMSEMGQGDETNLTISQKREAAAASEVKEKGMQGTENHYAWKMRYPQDFGSVHSKNDSPEPVFKGTVWNTLRTDVKKVLSDLSTRLMRPPSSDVMHMRPLIREELGTIHFGKSEQETSKPLKPIVTHAATAVVHSKDPEMLPMSKYFDHSQSQQKVTTPDTTPTELSSITTKSVSRQKRASAFPHAAGGGGGPTPCLPGTQWLP